jgi:filamentous hemagglutinin family protein
MAYSKRSIPALAAAALIAACQASANPTGPTVTHGSATFSGSGNSLTVQNTPGTIINWQGFSIGGQDVTRFIQQGGNSAVLNRVVGGNPSLILGQLQSNGRVFVANPNGVMFGAGAQVNAASFTATTGSVADNSFAAGNGSPVGGATMTVGGALNIMGPAVLSGNGMTIDGGLSTPGSLSITTAGSLTVNGSVTATNLTVLTSGGTTTGGGGITVGSGVTITTPGGITPGGNVIVVGSGNPLPTPASVAPASASRLAPPSVRATAASPAPVSQALFMLEKREPRF